MEGSLMKDIQALRDDRGVTIHKAGVRGAFIQMRYRGSEIIGEVSAYITLDDLTKGVHMSRFIEVLDLHPFIINKSCSLLEAGRDLLFRMEKAHQATEAFIKIRAALPFFNLTPVTKLPTTRQIPIEIELEKYKDSTKCFLRIKMPVTSLCPCSKEISDVGAHNQKAIIDVRMQIISEDMSIEDHFTWLSLMGSAPIFELLKRPDEKNVTERAYYRPKFCEDIVRDVVLYIKEMLPGVANYSVVVESMESIHDHTALAIVDYFKFS